MKISLVIAHVDTVPDLNETLKSHAAALKGMVYEIIVCDNDSDPEDLVDLADVLSKRKDTVLVFEKTKGTVAPFQKAISFAQGEYLCIADAHTRVAPDFYKKQLAILDSSPEIGTLYAKCYFDFELSDFSYHYNWGYNGNWKSGFTVNPESDEPYQVLASQMGSALTRTSLFRKFGGFSKTCFNKYGGYTAEELLLSLKTQMWGYKVFLNPDTYYIHAGIPGNITRGVVKNQPEALTTAAYLLGGDEWLDKVAGAWEGRLYGGDSFYSTKEEAVEDIKEFTTKDRAWVIKNQVYSIDTLISMFEKNQLNQIKPRRSK